MVIFHNFKTVFLAICIETFPFLLIGAFIAAIIEYYVNEQRMVRFLKLHPVLQMIAASFMGFIFPLCECAIIPIGRGLLKKGIPVRTTLLFMLVAPIINPIALSATYFAFGQNMSVVLYRALLGLTVALVVSIIFGFSKKEDVLLEHEKKEVCTHCHHDHAEHEEHVHEKKAKRKWLGIIEHTLSEFMGVGKYLVIGAAVAASVQIFLPVNVTVALKQNNILSVFSLQTLGYLLSLCSHGDAFVAAGFIKTFSFYPVLAFLIISPLIDIKNTLVMISYFKKKFVVKFILSLFTLTFIFVLLMKWWRI